MNYDEILSRLSILEKRVIKGVKDNMQIQGIHLKIFPDGSGMVDADWSKCTEEMCREEKLLHAIFTTESALFEFSNIQELGSWLKDMTPKEDPVRIKAAAIKLKDGRVFTGKCHGNIVQSFPGKVEREATIGSFDGFMTSDGRFVDRQEARDIAVAAGQVPEDIGVLYSEDLMTFDENYFKEDEDVGD